MTEHFQLTHLVSSIQRSNTKVNIVSYYSHSFHVAFYTVHAVFLKEFPLTLKLYAHALKSDTILKGVAINWRILR